MEVNGLQAKKQELERTIHQMQNHKKHQELLHSQLESQNSELLMKISQMQNTNETLARSMDTLSQENQRMQKKLNSILKDMSEEERLRYGGVEATPQIIRDAVGEKKRSRSVDHRRGGVEQRSHFSPKNYDLS